MATHNHVTLLGNLTRDPELRTGKDNKPFTTFGLAVNEKWSTGERVDYFEIVAFNGTASAVAKLKKKGDPVLVDGKLRLSQWENQQGEKRSQVKVAANSIQFLNRAQPNNNNQAQAQEVNEEDFDDIPF